MRTEPRIVFDESDDEAIKFVRSSGEDTGAGRYFPSGIHPVTPFEVGKVVNPDRIEYAISGITAALENIVSGKVPSGTQELCPDAKLKAIRKLDGAVVILKRWLGAHASLLSSLAPWRWCRSMISCCFKETNYE